MSASTPTLWVLNGDHPPYPVAVTTFPFTLGRHGSNHLPLRCAAVSRHHAEIIKTDDGGLLLRDLNSSSGTFVNGEPVTEKRLADGDDITLGKTGGVRLLYLAEAATEAFLFEYSSDGRAQRRTLNAEKFTIGRSPDCQLALKSAGVSRYHAEIVRQPDGTYYLRDLNSVGGTYVNGQSIREVVLKTGDAIAISKPAVARFRFVGVHQPSLLFDDDATEEEVVLETTLTISERQARFLNPDLVRQAANVNADTLRRLSTLYALSHQLMTQTSVTGLAETWLTALFAALPLDYGVVLVGNPQTGQLEVVGSRGQGRPNQSVIARVQKDRVGCLSGDVRTDERFASTQSMTLGTRAALAAPINSGKRFWGVCYLSNEQRPEVFTGEDLEFVMATARTAGLMLDNLNLVCELRATQELLVHADRLATMGKMCASISHELRNRLALISGVDLIRLKYPHDPDVAQLTELALHGQRRALELVEEIRLFARNSPAQYAFELQALRPLLERLLSLMCVDPEIKRRTLTFQALAEPYAIVNEAKIEQVLINLVRNAVDATSPGAGTINVALGVEQGMATIHVTDNGHGIPAEILPRIWEPFFTTKGEHGTGLGLEICRRIVEAHHGRLMCTSQVGVGTRFTILLPAVSPPAHPMPMQQTALRPTGVLQTISA
ncbi:MAG: FHA domain-containing protein [Chloracidobacterium sp.]|nr:FHA domain-containing protein [Chloracidobacterium sp.]MDW8216914.1 FHA domain-containing protein [Acidobacteriota bacterium]